MSNEEMCLAQEDYILHIVYTSKASVPVNDQLLEDIVTSSSEYNKREKITGFLISRDGYFLQLLEGPETAVKRLYNTIKQDYRHNSLTIHAELKTRERIAKDWNMCQLDVNPGVSTSALMMEILEASRNHKKLDNVESILGLIELFVKDAQKIR